MDKHLEKSRLDFDEIKSRCALIDIIVKSTCLSRDEFRSTSEGLRGPCALCGRNGDFSINTSKNIFHCWKCDESGSPVQFIAKLRGKDPFEASKEIEALFGGASHEAGAPGRKKLTHTADEQKTSPETFDKIKKIWDAASEDGHHEYLDHKKIGHCPGLRYGNDHMGNHSILVPFSNVNKEFKYYQAINCIGSGKWFPPGTKLGNAFFLIGDIAGAKVIFLVEGPATAITVWEALGRLYPVGSFGSVVRMKTIVDEIHGKNPEIKMVVCLEQGEASTRNAKKIAHLPFVSFRMPDFDGMINYTKQGELSDHNDIVSKCNQPLSVVTEQLKRVYTMPETKKVSDAKFGGAIRPTKQLPINSTNSQITQPSKNLSESPNCRCIGDLIKEACFMEELKEKVALYRSNPDACYFSGLATGFKEFDKVVGGFQPGRIIVLAARTGEGKSWVALNFLKSIAIDSKIPTPVSLFSLEMSEDQNFCRLLSLCTGISSTKISQGRLSPEEHNKVEEGVRTLSKAPIFISHSTQNSLLRNLESSLEQTCVHDQSKLVIIDHLDLLVKANNNTKRVAELEAITRGLKLMAKRHQIPIMELAQYSREGKLKGSSSIEQNADIIFFVNRPDYDDPKSRPGEIDLFMDKNRDGEDKKTLSFFYGGNWSLTEKVDRKKLSTNSDSPSKQESEEKRDFYQGVLGGK